ncbi:hypothetical protein M3891_003016 [Vibrio metschnikovii]|nr:hypothetical protein [Vibrio metschnikovii]
MNIIIKETLANETLSIIDAKTGVDYIADFIGNQGALSDGQFIWNDEKDAFECAQDTFDWWNKVVAEHQALNYRIQQLAEEHGQEAVYNAYHDNCHVDLEDLPHVINSLLDEVFVSTSDF